MLIKLETKSGVKGLSFHSKKAWILASLESGVIQLWHYRRSTLIDQFEHHRGPVRGVHFHIYRPLFVSGGDDHKVKVWNYTLCSCLFSLVGHLDIIRTVQFHHKRPWIVSASDDHTIRIWNWESRTCVSLLTGHTRSVMSASFHPLKDLIVSASLDKTVRVWDFSALVDKTNDPTRIWLSQFKGVNLLDSSSSGAFLKFVLEGHDRGVNWAAFDTFFRYMIVSGSDDHQVKLWEWNDTRAWEVNTMRGHMSNVSCAVTYSISYDIVVSSSEDGRILVRDAKMQTTLQTLRTEHNDRFWILASHPEMSNLIAAGHDSGIIVFKLGRDRPTFSVNGNSVYIFSTSRGCALYFCSSLTEEAKFSFIRIQTRYSSHFNQSSKRLSYSSSENAVLIRSYGDEEGSYELYIIPKDYHYRRDEPIQDSGNGSGEWAVFVAKNRFAVLNKTTNQILVKNFKNEIVEKSVIPIVTNAIFYAGTEKLLCRAEDRVFIFDLQQRITLGELKTSFVRSVVWSMDMESVALLGKHSIVIASKDLVHQCTLHELVHVKSGAWDDHGVFIYSTLNHIKYCLPNGDSGIIKTVTFPLYIAKVSGSIIHCINVTCQVRRIKIDATEYVTKLSLLKEKDDQVINIIRSSKFCGQAMISYLKQKGFRKVDLHLGKDGKTRSNFALESGDIQTALAFAKEIDEKDYWCLLGMEALRRGNAGIVQYAYQRTKNFNRLSFLYLITGNLDKLFKMQKIAEANNDVMSQFHNAIFLGDIRERVKILENVGHLHLAYVTAVVHGLHQTVKRLAAELGDNTPSLHLVGKSPSLLVPPRPIIRGGDWPLLRVMNGTFEGSLDNDFWNTEE